MIKADDLFKIIKLVIATGYLKNYKPVSLLIVGKSGIGKTELLTHFKSKTISCFTDLSYSGLLQEMEKNTLLKHVLLPDFTKITHKKRATTQNLVSLLNAVTEEGITKIHLFNIDRDYRIKGQPRHIGLITATTKASFGQNSKNWASFGFVQRMLIISYDYKEETINDIIDYINGEEWLNFTQESIKFGSKEISSEKKFNSLLNPIANKSFRSLKTLQLLAKANALINRRKEVNNEDINEIKRLSCYMNLNYTKI